MFVKRDLRMAKPDYGCTAIHPQSGFAIRRFQKNPHNCCREAALALELVSEAA
jgi:hypothetical protein